MGIKSGSESLENVALFCSLRLGALLWEIRGEPEGKEGNGRDAQWFDAWLDENQIPRKTAYRLMEAYSKEMTNMLRFEPAP
jgi:hypothetical protein